MSKIFYFTLAVSSIGLIHAAAVPHIINGTEAKKHSIPWMAGLRFGDGSRCGGSLLRVNERNISDIVVTAAHCVQRFEGGGGFNVALGGHNWSEILSGEVRVPAVKVVVHPSYHESPSPWCPTENYAVSDIAIVKLKQSVPFSKTIQPIKLPQQKHSVAEGTVVTVAGWGWTTPAGLNSETLQEATVPIVSDEVCKTNYEETLHEDVMSCAGYFKEGGTKSLCFYVGNR